MSNYEIKNNKCVSFVLGHRSYLLQIGNYWGETSPMQYKDWGNFHNRRNANYRISSTHSLRPPYVLLERYPTINGYLQFDEISFFFLKRSIDNYNFLTIRIMEIGWDIMNIQAGIVGYKRRLAWSLTHSTSFGNIKNDMLLIPSLR